MILGSNALSKMALRAAHVTQKLHFSSISVKDIAFPQQKDFKNMSFETVKLDLSTNGIATLTLNRPTKGNAFNMRMWDDFRQSFEIFDSDNRVRAAILTGSSASFSTGMDLTVFSDIQQTVSSESCQGRAAESLGRVIQYLQDCVSAPERCRVPVIAAISGHCIGGAVDVVTACDLRYCTDDSSFCIKETDFAIVADIGTLQRLPKLIGDQACRELAYTGRVFKGKEAERLGIVLKSFTTEEEMRSHVARTAETIAEKSPLTIRGVKKTILHARDHDVASSLNQVKMLNTAQIFSSDLQEAFAGMMTKKKPAFRD